MFAKSCRVSSTAYVILTLVPLVVSSERELAARWFGPAEKVKLNLNRLQMSAEKFALSFGVTNSNYYELITLDSHSGDVSALRSPTFLMETSVETDDTQGVIFAEEISYNTQLELKV